MVGLVNAFKVAKAGKLARELQLDGADGTVPLLGDDDLGYIANFFEPFFIALLPQKEFIIAFIFVLGSASALQIVFLTKNEHDNVCVLLDGARFA